MDNQVKSDFNEKIKNINLDKTYSKEDLEFLKQIGDIARAFQTQYNAEKTQEAPTTNQRIK